MTNKLSNLEKIRKAYAMNYAALLNGDPIISFSSRYETLWFRGDYVNGKVYQRNFEEIETAEITGYLFMGQLGGNEPIEEGQKFRVKETGEVGYFDIEWGFASCWLQMECKAGRKCRENDDFRQFELIELEPVF